MKKVLLITAFGLIALGSLIAWHRRGTSSPEVASSLPPASKSASVSTTGNSLKAAVSEVPIVMYDNGPHGQRDYAEAVEWLRHGAENGDADSQSNLGRLYATGNGVPEDKLEAYYWISLALHRSHDDADLQARDTLGKALTPEQKSVVERRIAQFLPKSAKSK